MRLNLTWEEPERPYGMIENYQVRLLKGTVEPDDEDTTSVEIAETHINMVSMCGNKIAISLESIRNSNCACKNHNLVTKIFVGSAKCVWGFVARFVVCVCMGICDEMVVRRCVREFFCSCDETIVRRSICSIHNILHL